MTDPLGNMTDSFKLETVMLAATDKTGVNQGALVVAMHLMETAPMTLGAMLFNRVRGERLYCLWNDVCERDYSKLIDLTDEELAAFARADP